MTIQFLQLVWSHWHRSTVTHIPDPSMSADRCEGDGSGSFKRDAHGVGRKMNPVDDGGTEAAARGPHIPLSGYLWC